MKRTVTALAVVACSVFPGPAAAADTVESGWWWRAQAGIGGLLLPAPPGVDEGELYLSATPDGPSAVAAVRTAVPTGQTPQRLTVEVAEQTGEPVLVACATTKPWTPAGGGAWAARPVPDCAKYRAPGQRDEANWTFDLTAMPAGPVDLVLTDEGALSATTLLPVKPTSFVFAPPLPPALPSPATAPSAPTDVAQAPLAGGPAVAPAPALPAVPAPPVVAPDVPPAAEPQVAAPVAYVPSTQTSTTTGSRVAAIAVLALITAALLRSSSGPVAPPEPRGIGPFRKPRTAAPDPI